MRQYTFVDYATQAYATMVAGLILVFHNGTVSRWPLLLGIHLGIVALVHSLVAWHGRRPDWPALDFLRHFYPVLLYTFFFWETGELNRMFITGYLDPVAIQWDQALFGFQPSLLFMARFPYLPVSELFYAAYFSYYLMISGIGLALFLRDRGQFFHYVSVISFVFYVCYTIYIVVPIIGPRVFFHEIAGYSLPENIQALSTVEGYPEVVRSGVFFRLMAFIYRVFEAPGAAMPSSHVAIAWCTVFFSFRYLRPIRFIHAVVAVLLCLATIYCRYHYAVDVMAGLAAVAILLPLANWLYLRFAETRPESETAPAIAEAETPVRGFDGSP